MLLAVSIAAMLSLRLQLEEEEEMDGRWEVGGRVRGGRKDRWNGNERQEMTSKHHSGQLGHGRWNSEESLDEVTKKEKKRKEKGGSGMKMERRENGGGKRERKL